MPTLNGIDAARSLSRSSPKTKIILLTQHEEEQYIHEALEAGVKGYVLKKPGSKRFDTGDPQVCRGEFYLSPGISRAVMEAYRKQIGKDRRILYGAGRQVLQFNCGRKVHQRHGVGAGHQREDGRIAFGCG